MSSYTSKISPSYKSTFPHLESSIVDEYLRVKSLRKVGEKLGASGPSHETISKILKQNNVVLRKVSSWEKLTDTEQKEVIKQYNGENINYLAQVYNVCPQTIIRVLKKQNIEMAPRRKYHINITAFDSLTPESTYWLGYLFGRGNIKSNYHFDIVFTDDYQLERVLAFKEFIHSNQPITEIKLKRPNNKTYLQKRLVIGSKVLVAKFKTYQIESTTNMKYPNFIPKKLTSHFIRGVFDAKSKFITTPEVAIYLKSTPQFLTAISNIITEETGVEGLLNVTSSSQFHHPKNKGKLIYSSGQVVKKVLGYLHTATPTTLLSKKVQEFQQHL